MGRTIIERERTTVGRGEGRTIIERGEGRTITEKGEGT